MTDSRSQSQGAIFGGARSAPNTNNPIIAAPGHNFAIFERLSLYEGYKVPRYQSTKAPCNARNSGKHRLALNRGCNGKDMAAHTLVLPALKVTHNRPEYVFFLQRHRLRHHNGPVATGTLIHRVFPRVAPGPCRLSAAASPPSYARTMDAADHLFLLQPVRVGTVQG